MPELRTAEHDGTPSRRRHGRNGPDRGDITMTHSCYPVSYNILKGLENMLTIFLTELWVLPMSACMSSLRRGHARSKPRAQHSSSPHCGTAKKNMMGEEGARGGSRRWLNRQGRREKPGGGGGRGRRVSTGREWATLNGTLGRDRRGWAGQFGGPRESSKPATRGSSESTAGIIARALRAAARAHHLVLG